jgi:hypothetical protein
MDAAAVAARGAHAQQRSALRRAYLREHAPAALGVAAPERYFHIRFGFRILLLQLQPASDLS